MERHHLKRGQVYQSCASPDDAPRYVRIERPGGTRVLIADAATGRREREIDANRLHNYPDRNGVPRRTGYALADTHEWLTHLTEQALRGHPHTISASAIHQDVRRGGYLRLLPDLSLKAVRALVAALEAADWTVETSTTAEDELRVRFRGQGYCPSMHVFPGEGRRYCTRWRGHDDLHQDDLTLDQWEDDAPLPAAWWLPGQPLPGHTQPASA